MLNRQKIVDGLRRFNDKEYSGFESWPESAQDSASRFTNVIMDYATDIIPVSTTITVAGQTLYSMLTIMSSEMEFSLALGQFCIQLGLGMAPAFTAVPPVWTGIEFAPLKALGLGGGSAEQCAQMFATIIDTKFRTGTATNNSSGATVIWS